MNDPMAEPAHAFRLRVYYEDTDAAGMVYYANYLRFAERARTEMLRDMGVDHAALLADEGLVFVVRRCDADYRGAARLDDELVVRTRVLRVGGARIDARQDVMRGDTLLVRIQVRIACVAATGRPARLPRLVADRFRAAMAAGAAVATGASVS